jgi:hypothetical protein
MEIEIQKIPDVAAMDRIFRHIRKIAAHRGRIAYTIRVNVCDRPDIAR